MATTRKTKATAAAAAVVAAAAGLYVATTSGPVAGACVRDDGSQCLALSRFLGGKCPSGWAPVVSCDDYTPAPYPGATPVPNPTPAPTAVPEAQCYAGKTGECRAVSTFPHGACPLGWAQVANCPPAGATPVPTIPVPPISGPPTPLPTPAPVTCIGSVQLIQSDQGAVLLVDGAIVRQWRLGAGLGNRWQTTFSYTAVPLISGGN